MKIEGTVALVTGGASGIGKAICEKLLQGGAKIQFLDINKTTGEETQKTFNNQHSVGQAKFVYCDVTSHDQLEAAFRATVKEHGRLDIVVNNAAIMDESDWQKTLSVNLHSVIRSTFLGVELMKNGVIVNLSSTGGIHPVSFCPVYCASKFGVIGFSRSVAPTAYRKKGIRVNCVCPGGTDTDIYKAMERMELTKEQQELASNTPKQTPEAVAQCVVDLIKDETDVGQVVKVTYEDGVEFLNYNDVAVIDVNDERGKEVERTFGEKYGTGCIKFIRCDVSVERDLKEAFSQVISLWGQIDIVCNNAAVLDEDNWNKTLNINLGGVIHGTLLGLEQMKSGSVIINTSSTAGLSAWRLAPVYCATKTGIVAFSRSIANEAIRDKGIRVNCICPGRTDTEMDFPRHRLTKEETEAQDSLPKQPVAEVAKGVVELIEDDTKIGEVLVVCMVDGTKYKQFTNKV